MTQASVCSGIGGAEIAAEWAGWENVFHCEKNDFSRKVLDYYWPKSISYEDLTTTDFRLWRGKVDVFTAGFPCQPFSTAGKRKGTEDDRHLWPHVIRAIREIQPRYVVGENVRGFTNWNGGMVFDQVLSDLENEGYEVAPLLLPACGVNAPHRRDRIWIVAHSNPSSDRRERIGQGIENENGEQGSEQAGIMEGRFEGLCSDGIVTDADQFNGDLSGLRTGEIPQQQTSGILENYIADSKCPGLEGGIGPQRTVRSEQGGEEIFPNSISTNPDSQQRFEGRMHEERPKEAERYTGTCDSWGPGDYWQNFPTVAPVRGKYDGVSRIMVRNIKPEVYATINKKYTNEDLQKVRIAFQSEKIQREIGRLYKIHEPGVLLQTVQLCQAPNSNEVGVSRFSEEASKGLLRKLRKYGSFANTPQGRKLEKQFAKQFADTLPVLSHEIALVTMEAERAALKFSSWHHKESIKAYGNALVPQVMYEIFKVINQMESQINVA